MTNNKTEGKWKIVQRVLHGEEDTDLAHRYGRLWCKTIQPIIGWMCCRHLIQKITAYVSCVLMSRGFPLGNHQQAAAAALPIMTPNVVDIF
jgi:hypothetical protein